MKHRGAHHCVSETLRGLRIGHFVCDHQVMRGIQRDWQVVACRDRPVSGITASRSNESNNLNDLSH
jgi:hypothetical protein